MDEQKGSQYFLEGMEPESDQKPKLDPRVGNYSEPFTTARALEFDNKLNALRFKTWDFKAGRKLTDTEHSVLSALYANARILEVMLAKHNNDYSQCKAWAEGCLDSLHQAKELAEMNRVPFGTRSGSNFKEV